MVHIEDCEAWWFSGGHSSLEVTQARSPIGCIPCDCCTVKTFGLLQPLFQLPQLHVCGVCIMKFKECFQSSEDLEIKTLRSFLFNYQSSFQKTNQLPFLEKAWLHSYGRNASNVHVAEIGLPKDKIMKKLLDGIQETYFRSIPG